MGVRRCQVSDYVGTHRDWPRTELEGRERGLETNMESVRPLGSECLLPDHSEDSPDLETAKPNSKCGCRDW